VNVQGSQNYSLYLQVNGKPVRMPVLIGPSDDTRTEVLRWREPGSAADAWKPFDGTELVLVGNLDALGESQKDVSAND
jgi:hypothetical protein